VEAEGDEGAAAERLDVADAVEDDEEKRVREAGPESQRSSPPRSHRERREHAGSSDIGGGGPDWIWSGEVRREGEPAREAWETRARDEERRGEESEEVMRAALLLFSFGIGKGTASTVQPRPSNFSV
jgi:hypothetical protein